MEGDADIIEMEKDSTSIQNEMTAIQDKIIIVQSAINALRNFSHRENIKTEL